MRTSKTRTIAAVALTLTLAIPAVAAPSRDNDGGPVERIVRVIRKFLAPPTVRTMDQPIVPIPKTTT